MPDSPTRQLAADRLAWRAQFLSRAREIVRRDRQCHRFNIRYDTVTVIADAMEQAFMAGLSRVQGGAPERPGDAVRRIVPWDSIPPAPRRVFWTIGVFALGRGPAESRQAVLSLGTVGRCRSWFLSVGGEPLSHGLFRPKEVKQLIQLGLLRNRDGELVLTESGQTSWWTALAATPNLFPQFSLLVPQAQ